MYFFPKISDDNFDDKSIPQNRYLLIYSENDPNKFNIGIIDNKNEETITFYTSWVFNTSSKEINKFEGEVQKDLTKINILKDDYVSSNFSDDDLKKTGPFKLNKIIGKSDISTIKTLRPIKKSLNDFSKNKSIISNGRRNSKIIFSVDDVIKTIIINNTNFQTIDNKQYYSINFNNKRYRIIYLNENNQPTSKFFKFKKESTFAFDWFISNGYLYDEKSRLGSGTNKRELYEKDQLQKSLKIESSDFDIIIDFDVNFNLNLLSIKSLILNWKSEIKK